MVPPLSALKSRLRTQRNGKHKDNDASYPSPSPSPSHHTPSTPTRTQPTKQTKKHDPTRSKPKAAVVAMPSWLTRLSLKATKSAPAVGVRPTQSASQSASQSVGEVSESKRKRRSKKRRTFVQPTRTKAEQRAYYGTLFDSEGDGLDIMAGGVYFPVLYEYIGDGDGDGAMLRDPYPWTGLMYKEGGVRMEAIVVSEKCAMKEEREKLEKGKGRGKNGWKSWKGWRERVLEWLRMGGEVLMVLVGCGFLIG